MILPRTAPGRCHHRSGFHQAPRWLSQTGFHRTCHQRPLPVAEQIAYSLRSLPVVPDLALPAAVRIPVRFVPAGSVDSAVVRIAAGYRLFFKQKTAYEIPHRFQPVDSAGPAVRMMVAAGLVALLTVVRGFPAPLSLAVRQSVLLPVRAV